jgi:methylmalonyl-CoA mutase
MFEDFTTTSYEDWVAQANQETLKIESIHFPFHFNLDGLSLGAINTKNQLGTDPKVVHEVKHTQPVISICQEGDISKTDWQQLGIEDLFFDYTKTSFWEDHIRHQQLRKLSSIGICYQPDKLDQTMDFWMSAKAFSPPKISFYPRIVFKQLLTGGFSFPDYEKLAKIINQVTNTSSIKCLGIRGDEFMNQGVNTSLELAITLSLIAHYWDKLTDLKLSKERILHHTEVALGLSGEFYLDLVKMRAARSLLYSLIDAFEIPYPSPSKINIRAVSGLLNKTLYDPDENLLRITVEALAATLGGANIISLRTHDLHYQIRSSLGQRMAANIQNLIRHESHLHRVCNPVDGSYFIEYATRQLIDAAWQNFLEIENEGGIERYLNTKSEALFAKSKDQQEKLFLQQRKKRVGVTRYINEEEKINRSVVNSDFRQYSLTYHWEETRLQVDQLPSQNVPRATIVAHNSGNGSIVSKRITFVIDTLNSLGVACRVVNVSEFTNDKPTDAALFILCADDDWYQLHLPEFLTSNSVAGTPLFVVGSVSELSVLAENTKVNGVLNTVSDLSPLIDTVRQLIDHEA